MGTSSLRSLLLAAIVLCNCITWTASKHHYRHNINGHRSRHRRQGAGLFLPASYVIPGGEGSGAWGEWGQISPCSRTCGGGVASQKRICLEFGLDGRPLCTGGDTKYFSCQTHDCPEDAGDFRAEQCAEFNDKLFRDQKIYTWVPYTKGHNPCELNCMPRGERFYYRQREKVVDGTRCNDESFDVCVNGTCQAVGCDMMLGSNAREDKCRECRGNGTNCKTMEGLIDDIEGLRRGYNDVLLIPQGATNIIIEEIRASSNYLALRAKERTKYYLNGDYHIDFPRSLVIAGAVWHYERNQMGFAAPDRLRCIGPINEPLYLSLLLQEDNVGVKYEYSIPSNLAPRPEMRYDWVFNEFSECSATCGGGIQMRTVTCRSRDDLEQVDESLCDNGLMPSTNQTCNTQPCPPHWVEGPWSPCSKPCGEGGTRSREVHCEKIITNGVNFRFPSIVADQECIGLLGAKPNPYEECNKNATCPTWFTGPWKPCDKLCGKGVQTRQVVCHTKVNGRVEVFDDNECADEKPVAEQSCNPQPCKGLDFVLSDWTGCDSCLSENRVRVAQCVTTQREVVDYSFCSYHPVPILEEPCDKSKLPPCETQWYATQWSNCSVDCGTGVQTRRVFCGMLVDGAVQEVEASRCDAAARYRDSKPCEVPKEKCTAKWFAGPWTNCSAKCGGGQQTREVMCLTGDKVEGNCAQTDVLASLQTCNMMPCNEDEMLPVDSKSTPIMDDVYYDYQDQEDCEDEDEEINKEVGAEIDEQVFPEVDYGEVTEEIGSGSDITSDYITTEGSGFGSTFETESTSTTDTSETSESTSTDSTITMTTGSDITDSSTEESITESSMASVTDSGKAETVETFGSDNTESAAVDVTASTETTETSSTDSTYSTDTIETDATDTSDTDSTSTTDANSGSTDATDDATESTVTSGTEVTESSSTETSNVESSSTETSTMETGSTETGSTETSVTETTETITTESTEVSSTGSTDTTEVSSTGSTDTTEVSSTESTTSTDVSETSSTDSISTNTDISTEESTVGSDKDTSTVESSTESGSTQTTEEAGSSTTENVSDSSYSTTESTSESSTTESEESSTVLSTTESETSTTGETEETSGSTESSSTEESSASETVSEVSTISSTDVTESTESTVTASTEYTESTTTGGTESTDLSSTASTDQTGLTTEFSTSTDWGTTIKDLTSTKRHCRPKKIPKCLRSKYGCCKDKRTPARGPFDQGCPDQKTCKETPFKCCSDGVSPAAGPNNEGCPVVNCNETLYGCCRSDNTTPAEGNDQEGCPKPQPPCKKSKYGCCADGKTEAKGLKKKGCPETQKEKPEGKPEEKPKEKPEGCSGTEFGCCADNETAATGADGAGCPCNITEFGCCPDGVSPAGGSNMEGCIMSCNSSMYGCCPDGQTPAHGPDYEGCCLQTAFGCCPDNYKPADGPHMEGCGCQYARYGCCPDNKTIARGPDNEGCGCQYTQFGCCPDSHTEAKGPEFEGCDCNTYQFGCCPDGYTTAKGPNLQGCLCQQSEFGCCGDEQTAARGPNQLGCDCSTSKYGCCPDGVTEAQGEKFLNCTDVPENRQESCALDNEQGPCRNYTVRWYYDAVYGGCSQFWYGGCEGNGNRFASQDECEDVCVRPAPKDACNLPSIRGACNNPTIRWYYNSTREQCLQFQYGGCLGNANNFESRDVCQKQCEPASSEDQCSLPLERGSCAGNFPRWGFNTESGRCEQFLWGGCEGNTNRFGSEAACVQRCSPPGVPKPECSLPQESGSCGDKLAVWAFKPAENRCLPFYYSGCGGNDNRFESENECARACPSSYEKDTCVLPAVTGDCGNYTARWFFDTSVRRCRQFYYGGCGGNDNNFLTEEQCEGRCSARTTTPPPAPAPTAPAPTAPTSAVNNNICFLARDPGPCGSFSTRWAYEAARGGCVPFEYGGCGGNTNNFDARETCEAYCSQIQDVCQLPEMAGPCVDWSLHWFYDASIDSCRQFYYGGCEGNDNRFETQEACEQRCRQPEQRPQLTTTTAAATTLALSSTTSRAPAVQVSVGSGDVCSQPMESGNCMGYTVLWYYDELRQACGQFVYTDCGGNDNRFATEAECEDRCIRRIAPTSQPQPQTTPPPAITTTTYLPPVQPEQQPCRTPVTTSPCGENITSWYYDGRTGACLRGDHGACGDPNSHASEEECERTCGAFRNIDVCRAVLDPGPCFYSVDKVYWDAASGRCLPFTYGGCLGGPNRFSSFDECEEVCGGTGPEPECLQAVDSGRGGCGAAMRRWWYDVTAADCRAFVYLGCGGNDNNFRSYDECAARCRPDTIDNEVIPSCQRFEEYCERLRCDGPVQRTRGPDGCVRCECAAPPATVSSPPPAPAPAPVDCEPARQACEALYCDLVLERTTGPDGCEICQCVDPCANTTCGAGERCVHEPYVSAITAVTGDVTYLPECRAMNKSGWCPRMANNESSCGRECNDDADCRGVGKCCTRGCQAICVVPLPTVPTVPTAAVPTTTYTPELPRAPQANREQTEDEVSAAEGGTATLRCLFHGNPPPSITWRRGEITIESDRERYRLLSDGALEIVSIYRNDSGVYICIGSNSLGSVSQEVNLVVNDPEEGPAGIAGAARAVARGRLGRPLAVRCLAHGWPTPSIYWYHGRDGPMVPYSSELYEARGNVLQIRSLIPEALGEYICQAYNGIGKAAEWSVLVQLDEPQATLPTTEPPTELTTTTAAPSIGYQISWYTVPVQTRILADRTTVSAGSELSVRCDVDGYPVPDVFWTKDSVRLLPTDRIMPTEARLTISNANINDSGEYGCHASNAYSSHSASVRITVQGVYIPAKCTDNPFFANCALIVRSRFCNHHYYSRFCCKSCVEAGQLDPQEVTMQADEPWKKRK